MNQVEKYVYAVGTHLPKSNREDIMKELRSTILDMAEERDDGERPMEQIYEEVLLELGEPRQFALKYRNTGGYLIGPALMDTYLFVLKIVLTAVTIGIGIATIVEAAATASVDMNISREIMQFFGNLFSAGIGAIGMVTLVFFLIERNGGKVNATPHKAAWHPSRLEAIPASHGQAKRSDAIFSIVFSVLALVVLNFYADHIGIRYDSTGISESGTFLQVLSLERLQAYLVYWNILWLVTIGIGLYQLKTARHTLLSRGIELLGAVAGIILMVIMFQDAALLNQAAIDEALALAADKGIELEKVLGMSWRITLVVFIVIIAVDLLQKLRAVWKFMK